jgi:hypothetical protein
MKGKFLAIDRWWDKRLKMSLMPQSFPQIVLSLLTLPVIIGFLFLTLNSLCAVSGLVLIYLPRLCGALIGVCIVIPACTILLRLLGTRLNPALHQTAPFLSVLLALAGMGLFGFGGLVSMVMPQSMRTWMFPSHERFPIAELEGIAVDDKGHVYLAIQSYGRIQVYDAQGKFLQGWFVTSGGGAFRIWMEDHLLHAVSVRGNVHEVFDLNGHCLKKTKMPQKELDGLYEQAPHLEEHDIFGNTYVIRKPHWCPGVIRRDAQSREAVLITDPLYYQLPAAPLPAWLLGAAGIIMAIIVTKVNKRNARIRGADLSTAL